MAVKPEVIKARLKAKYPKANLSTKRLDAIAAKLAPKPADDADDVAVDAILEAANDFMSFEEIAKEDDRVRTLEANQKPKTDPPLPPAPEPPAPPVEEAPSWAKGLIESNQKLTQEIEALKTGKVTDTKKQTAQQLFEKSEVLKNMKPEIKAVWLNRIAVTTETSEDEILSQITSLETEYSDLTQNFADTYSFSGPPAAGDPNLKVDDKVLANIVETI